MREVIVKIGLKQKEKKEQIIMEVLLDSIAIGLVMSLKFVKNKFKKKKLERPIYIRNVNSVKIVDGGLYFIFSFYFYFTFSFLFFSFFYF